MNLLNEETIDAFIAQPGLVLVMGEMPNCSHCERYLPVFTSVCDGMTAGRLLIEARSEFKRKYMRAEKGERLGAPGTFMFRDGSLVKRHFGDMDEQALREWISSDVPVQKIAEKARTLADLTKTELKAIAYDQMTNIENAQSVLLQIKQEIAKRGR